MNNVSLLFGNVFVDCISVEINGENLICITKKCVGNFAKLVALGVNFDVDGDENYIFGMSYDRVSQVRYL